MRLTLREFRAWDNKCVTLLGMSGVGKTRLATLLRRQNWFHYSGDYRIGTRYLDEAILDNIKQQADAGRKRLKELLTASVPLFKASKFFLNPEMSLADCAMAPIIWRLPSLDIPLPKDGKAIEDYGNRIFRNPGFVRSLTDKEKTLRDLPL